MHTFSETWLSVAGLLAASVCADHFDSVVVVDAEATANELAIDLPTDTEIRTVASGLPTRIPARKRVMQYLAIHREWKSITDGRPYGWGTDLEVRKRAPATSCSRPPEHVSEAAGAT